MIGRRKIYVDVPNQSARFIVLRNRGSTRNQFESLADAVEFARQFPSEEPLIAAYQGNKWKVKINGQVEQIGVSRLPTERGFPILENALPGGGLYGMGCPECGKNLKLGRSRLGTLGICPACLIAAVL